MAPILPEPRPRTRIWSLALALLFLAGLAALTLTPARVEARLPNLLDLALAAAHRLGWQSLDFTRIEILANILVFVPVGILAFLLVPRRVWGLSLLVGPAASLAIETAQRLLLPHRAATLSDVLANSAGATIGVVLAVLCTAAAGALSAARRSSRLEAL